MDARQARLAALRAEAAAAGLDGEAAGPAGEQQQAEVGQQQEATAPVLRFRNYAPVDDERVQHEKVAPAKVAEFEEVTADVDPVGDDTEEVLINVAPKKANWDLRRDIAGSLARLERRTQAAMIKLMQQEEQRRQEEEEQQGE